MKRWLVGVLVAALAVPVTGTGTVSASPIPMPPELWLMDADGSGQRRLYPPDPEQWAYVSPPSWSPDAREVAFLADGALRIYSLTSETQRVVIELDSATHVEWSPTGEWLAVVAWGSPRGLFLVRPDGTDWHHVGPDAQAVAPAWSPDGSSVAATYYYGPDQPIHLAVVSVQGDVRVLASDINYTTSSWRPDGTRLAYVDSDGRLSVVASDGSIHEVTDPGASYGDVAWSPDGSKIAYAGAEGVVAVNPDGSGKIALLPAGSRLDWEPTGAALAAGHGDDIFRVAKDGSGITNLTNDADRYDTDPAWSPDGTKIAYLSSEKPYIPPDETIERTISLRARRHLVLKGVIEQTPGSSGSCSSTPTTVILKRRKANNWFRIARVNTSDGDRFRLKVPDRPGRYRAVVRKKVFGGHAGNEITCTWARSNTVIHRH